MSFKIRDNYRSARNVDGLSYYATVDGQWILMRFDAKNDLLFHRFEADFPKGEHQLRLVVKDAVGNESVFESKFLR